MNARKVFVWGTCAWLVVVVLWLTWSPFVLREDAASIAFRFPSSPVDLLGNLMLLVPLALAVGILPGRRTRREVAIMLAALVGLSLIIEFGQIWVARRFVSPYDVLLNATGAGMGLWTGRLLEERGADHRRVLTGVILLLYAAVLAFLAFRMFGWSDGTQLTDWRAEYSVKVGDEIGGTRPYRGLVLDSRICVPGGSTICIREGADSIERTRLVRAAEREQRLIIEATVRSESDQQSGPARIITFSRDTSRRNVTLAQRGNSVILRLRTPLAGPNGTELVYVLDNAVPVGRTTNLRARYDRGRVRMLSSADGTERRVRYTSDQALLSLVWGITGGRVEAVDRGQITRASGVGVLLILLPPVLLLILLRTDRHSDVRFS